MAVITRPQILLHSRSCYSPPFFNKPLSFPFPNRTFSFSSATRLRPFSCATNTNTNGSASNSIVSDLLDYLNESWTHFHATAEAKRQLVAAGFQLLKENEEWELKPGGRYFFTRNMSCLVAFAIGQNTVNQSGFKPNLEKHLLPLLSIKHEEISLESKEKTTAMSSKPSHHPLLMQVLSDELNCDVDDIVSVELNVCDTQPSCLGGGNDEFIFSGRLDNLASSYCALRALIDSCESPGDLADEHAVRMVALFDNEESLQIWLMEFIQILWTSMKNTTDRSCRKGLSSNTMQTSDMRPVESHLFCLKKLERFITYQLRNLW
ncbi:hypothetical protein PIB30_039769 [Stylosanthes scabra]|uniref:aspartyl aminopeptidase n=1 Tax=Stylosanthes scabra TaxID=79078 RepID=A0ABU6UD32_9FABA|nr:hypothetical protein [Stylosanthes scabra]